MNRSEAEKWLFRAEIPIGAFLVRFNKASNCSLSLSLKVVDKVVHYRIRQLHNDKYFITRRVMFCTIQELIDYYQKNADGLAQRLSVPCVCPHPPVTKYLSYKEEWEIHRNLLQFDKKLGMGNFSEVWSGLWSNSVPVAIKILKPGAMKIMKAEKFVAEAQKIRKFSHPNLLHLYAVCTLEEPIYIVTELMKYGALLDYMRKGDGQYLKLPQLIDMAAQVAGGMAYLEEHSYIHRDLAARNILVGESIICKVADFGLACVIKKDIYNPQDGTKFPVKWTAPEAALYNKFSIKSDVWSFGIVIYELITFGRMPYPCMNNHEALKAVKHGYRMPPPMGCPCALYSGIMLSCWEREPNNRPTFELLQFLLEDYFVVSAERESGYRSAD
ncbi:tyrosine-protein kinase SRK3-like [Dysidea avara]|uniref:tyrosine-protein kinase SRK3-like n=1 Tax=Dysidea avara TaxID=196820 RepID=UPI003329E16B